MRSFAQWSGNYNADLPVLPAGVIASNCPHTCPKRTRYRTWPRQSSVQWMIFVKICAKQVNFPVTHPPALSCCHPVRDLRPRTYWDVCCLASPHTEHYKHQPGDQCQCWTPKYHLMSVFLLTLIDDLWSVVTQDNSALIRLRFLARYNKSWWSTTSSSSWQAWSKLKVQRKAQSTSEVSLLFKAFHIGWKSSLFN